MNDQIKVSVLIRATWEPDLEEDVEYPTIEAYAARVRKQFETDPLGALGKLPDPRVIRALVDVVPPSQDKEGGTA